MLIAITSNERFRLLHEEEMTSVKMIRDGRFVRVGNITYPLYKGLSEKDDFRIRALIAQRGAMSVIRYLEM